MRRLGIAFLVACGPLAPPPQPPATVEVKATSDAPRAVPLRPSSARARDPRITDQGVGAVAIGKPLPAALLGGNLEKHYVTTLYADAQPLEGFRLAEPALVAYVNGGPYHDFGMSSPGEALPDGMAAEAVKLARAGKLTVKMLVITEPSLRTEKKIGVGSSFRDVMTRYAAPVTLRLPGLWEEPTCVAMPVKDSPLWFFFAECASSMGSRELQFDDDAPVIRVVVRSPD